MNGRSRERQQILRFFRLATCTARLAPRARMHGLTFATELALHARHASSGERRDARPSTTAARLCAGGHDRGAPRELALGVMVHRAGAAENAARASSGRSNTAPPAPATHRRCLRPRQVGELATALPSAAARAAPLARSAVRREGDARLRRDRNWQPRARDVRRSRRRRNSEFSANARSARLRRRMQLPLLRLGRRGRLVAASPARRARSCSRAPSSRAGSSAGPPTVRAWMSCSSRMPLPAASSRFIARS